jgi:flagellar protein FliT
MTQSDLLQPLHRFLDQSQRLLALAEAGEWEAFEALLAERQKGLASVGDNALLIAVAKAGLADEMRQLLAEIQTSNNRVAEVAERSRADLAVQLRQVVQAEKAIDAYKK